jgi:uncharacterized Zn-binding protein involved in type VI secretion
MPHTHSEEATVTTTSIRTAAQVRQYKKPIMYDDQKAILTVEVRYDDRCGNGHNTFSITGDIATLRGKMLVCGCIHDKIAAAFPQLMPLLKWHLCSTNGPLHYIENTCYLAGDLDYRGMRKGERRQLRNGKTNTPVWQRVVRDSQGLIVNMLAHDWRDADTEPTELLTVRWEPVWIEGKGKARELEAARKCAIWPEATDDDLSQSRDALTAALLARLPQLLAEFKAAVESFGFVY